VLPLVNGTISGAIGAAGRILTKRHEPRAIMRSACEARSKRARKLSERASSVGREPV
jgi:hypothetical protein